MFMENEFSESKVWTYGVIAGALIVFVMFFTVVL